MKCLIKYRWICFRERTCIPETHKSIQNPLKLCAYCKYFYIFLEYKHFPENKLNGIWWSISRRFYLVLNTYLLLCISGIQALFRKQTYFWLDYITGSQIPAKVIYENNRFFLPNHLGHPVLTGIPSKRRGLMETELLWHVGIQSSLAGLYRMTPRDWDWVRNT